MMLLQRGGVVVVVVYVVLTVSNWFYDVYNMLCLFD
jgi:hypothetical protein